MDEIAEEIENLYNYPTNEIPEKYIRKICELLGGEHQKNRRGSHISYYHKLLDGEKDYAHGIISWALAHGKSAEQKVFRKNYRNFTYPSFKKLVQLKKETL